MTSSSPKVAQQNKMESSANIKFVINGALLHIETHLMWPSSFALDSSELKPSAHKRNRYGERGLP